MKLKCPKCGRELPYGSTYCLFCDMHVENDEIPVPSEPTRVMPPVGKPKKEPPKQEEKPPKKPPKEPKQKSSKNDKNKKAVLFYFSISLIALVVVALIVIIIVTCFKPKKKTPSFNFSTTTSYHGFVSEESGTMPTYSIPNKIESSSLPPSSSQAPSSSSSSSSSSSQNSSTATSSALPAAKPADQYLGVKVSDLKKNFGEIASKDPGDGINSILSFNACKYRFIIETEEAADSDKVSAIIVAKGGEITKGVKVGMTKKEIYDHFGSIQIVPDEEGQVSTATYDIGNAKISIYFGNGEDKPSTQALVKYE